MRWVGVALVVSGCAPDSVVELGVLEGYGHPIAIELDTSVAVGEPLVVSALTFNDDCNIAIERTDLDVVGDDADVSPFDRRWTGEGTCLLILEVDGNSLLHEVTITFDTPGTKTIRVHGRRVNGLGLDQEIEVPFSVVVE